MTVLFAQSIEITTPWIIIFFSLITIVSSFALYVIRIEMKAFVQNAIQDAISDMTITVGDRSKEINRRIDTIERDGNALRTEVGAMSTSQSFMATNINKLEIGLEKMEQKLDIVTHQGNENKQRLASIEQQQSTNSQILKAILEKLNAR